MKLPLYQVDAFTSERFSGNPAAVVILEEWLPEELMLAIAAENNLSETAFVVPGREAHGLRWFTPEVEVDLCGHATLATAYVLLEVAPLSGVPEGLPSQRDALSPQSGSSAEVRFHTQESGRLRVRRDGDLFRMDFPARPGAPTDVRNDVSEALRRVPEELLAGRDLMAVYATEAEIVGLAPDFGRVASLDALGVIVTAPGDDADFVSRFFAPNSGIPEDPVTGSTHCTLVPYWARRLGRSKLRAQQLSKRGGELFCEDRGERVSIAGRAVLYLEGSITI